MAGFNLLELLAAVAMIAILLAVGVPTFRTQVLNARLSSATNNMLSSLNFARAEAVGRQQAVSVCHRNSTGTGCSGNEGWEDGWVVYVDANGSGGYDNGDEIVHVQEPLANGITARGTGNAASVLRYLPNGMTNLASAEVVVLCDDRGFDDARGIHLSILGKGSALGAFEAGGTGCQTIRDIFSQ